MCFDDLPSDWLYIKLGDVVEYGKTQKCELSDVSNDTWILELEDVEKESSRIVQRLNAAARPFKSTKNKFKKGEVLYGKLRPYLNKVVIADQNGVCSTEIIPLDAAPHIDNRYLFYWLKGETFLNYVVEVSYGVNMPRLGTQDGLLAPFVLPPLAEQKVIAEKLVTMLAQVDNTKARLERIPEILKRFRQSVLAAAVSGKLTEEWCSTESTLAEVAEFQNGFAFKSEWFETTGQYQVIKLGNIRDGYLALENSPAFVSNSIAEEFAKFTPNTGDTLLSMTGTRFKKDYGFGCLVNDQKNLLINQRVGRLMPNQKSVLPAYLNIFVRSDKFRDQFFAGETGGVNQGNVGSKHIMSIELSLPSIDIQTEIVCRVEELFAFADRIEHAAQAALSRVNNLTQSILAKAFRGELTADWRAAHPELLSGENSAEALLERIKTERAKVKIRKKA
ncbi:restriction endonuclease subunit S [Rheinheimera sp. UJ63]|uniref:restriction endonuclease subunit S n=1 Tax=Rheinheimera sp. UJ63 TaxID=2910157 RepID=UPI001F359239|nr:restriction endonuclease subunit S [Rheinheimera sp. UJ63]MCF4009994.1 restriction endonuclease subunit S [Rheinheimera sp. UJ63]